MSTIPAISSRHDLARVYELRDLLPDPVPPSAYFVDFDQTLAEWPGKKASFLEVEADLQGLDADAWAFLKTELAPLLKAKHPTRGWHQLFDKLNQAKGYNYLKRCGLSDVRFIRERSGKGILTPDIEAVKDGRIVLCEVKTVNNSNVEADRRHTGGVANTKDYLDEPFLRKLRSTVDQAIRQMRAYNDDSRTLRIAYVIINFDDMFHEYVDRYAPQLRAIRSSYHATRNEIVLCYKGPFGLSWVAQ